MECSARGHSSPCLKAGDSLPHPVEGNRDTLSGPQTGHLGGRCPARIYVTAAWIRGAQYRHPQ